MIEYRNAYTVFLHVCTVQVESDFSCLQDASPCTKCINNMNHDMLNQLFFQFVEVYDLI